MAKRDPQQGTRSYFSYFNLPIILLIAILGVGGWWLWNEESTWKDFLIDYIENREILSVESKYTPQQIMEAHRLDLIGEHSKRSFGEFQHKYYPYLLLDVKYTENQKSREGYLLWSLYDGEIVLNNDTWNTTHGLKDCLEAKANRHDFKILQTLAPHQEGMSIEELQKALHVERELLEPWLEAAKKKHLVTQKGNQVQLHFENPRIVVAPQTRMVQNLVSKSIQIGQKGSRRYSPNQIIEISQNAFGNDFKIRSQQEIYLPVYSLAVVNADGSIFTSEWNAVTGERMGPRYLKN